MNAGELFDSLPESARDMPRHLFIKKINELTDQRNMQRDLGRILRGRYEKGKIDSATGRNP